MIRGLHLPLFLVALVSAVGIKVAVEEALQLTEATIDAKVQYELPEGLMILEPVEEVKVRLRGPSDEIVTLNPFNVAVRVELSGDERGQVDITEDRMSVSAPGDFEVISIEPNRISLKIEPLERVTLPVRAVLTGEPAAGASHGTPAVRPANATVVGPRSRVRNVRELTAPVSLQGHALSFEDRVTIVSPDPLVRVVEPTHVIVFVPMEIPGTGPVFGQIERNRNDTSAGRGALDAGPAEPLEESPSR